MRVRLLLLGALFTTITLCADAADLPGDETTNRKQLELYQADPAHMERLRQNLTAFRAMSKDDRDRLRQLDKDLYEKDELDRKRLRGIMERYANWVARLRDEDRAKLSAAAPGLERLQVVQEILERQWQDSLCLTDKERLKKAAPEERTRLLDQLRKEDEERRRVRIAARHTAEESAALGGESRERFTAFLDESLRPLLSEADEKRLNSLTTRREWSKFFEFLSELSKPIDPLPFPGPAPPGRRKAIRTLEDLPPNYAERLGKPLPAEIESVKGKWPDFPQAIAQYVKTNKIEFPLRLLGPTRADELPNSVRRFLQNDLSGKLNDAESRELDASEGLWPEYPKKIKELAARHQLTVPGLTRPQGNPGGKGKGAKGPPA